MFAGLVITATAGGLMVSRLPYYSGKDFNLGGRIPFGYVLLIPAIFILISLNPPTVLFALFFVFQNTIEFRGVEFLWLADISQKDPFYILPVVMGGSMFLLSWIGMRNAPPNPQAKIMLYALPLMMMFFLFNFAAGLNLYYAAQNIAALPQQWLIANERAKMAKKKPA
jgi:YidC/Oxa1 family membrane protein insertase